MRAYFKCTQIVVKADSREVTLSPMCAGVEAPVTLMITDPANFDEFVVGQGYEINIPLKHDQKEKS